MAVQWVREPVGTLKIVESVFDFYTGHCNDLSFEKDTKHQFSTESNNLLFVFARPGKDCTKRYSLVLHVGCLNK